MSGRDIAQRCGPGAIGSEAIVVFTAATLAAAWMSWGELPGRSGLVPLTWAFASWLPIVRYGSWAPALDLSRPDLVRGLKLYAASTAVLLPLAVAGFEFYRLTGRPIPAAWSLEGVSLAEWSLYQIAVVATSEELFFRGYLQGRLGQACRSAGARKAIAFWLPIVGSALLFALAHVVVTRKLEGAGVVVPGLLFAWLRARSGSLVASVLSHGTANVVTRLVLLHAANG